MKVLMCILVAAMCKQAYSPVACIIIWRIGRSGLHLDSDTSIVAAGAPPSAAHLTADVLGSIALRGGPMQRRSLVTAKS